MWEPAPGQPQRLTTCPLPLALPQMTGRKGRVVSRPDRTVAFESRGEQGLSIEHVNLREKERFMSGEKVRAARQGQAMGAEPVWPRCWGRHRGPES